MCMPEVQKQWFCKDFAQWKKMGFMWFATSKVKKLFCKVFHFEILHGAKCILAPECKKNFQHTALHKA